MNQPLLEHVDQGYNFDLQNIHTPVQVSKLVNALREANYDSEEIRFLEKGFTEGFDIGYQGPELRQSESSNIPLTVGSKTELWNKLIKEVNLKRVAGPYEQIPFDNYIQSPISLVPKAGSSKTRLIFHLSYNFNKGKWPEDMSLNYHTPREKCSVHYNDMDDAIRACLAAQ